VLAEIQRRFREAAPAADRCTLRVVSERSEALSVRQNVIQPVQTREDVGAMVTVIIGRAMGYAATSDLSVAGLRRAGEEAKAWAARTSARSVVDFTAVPMDPARGSYETPVVTPWQAVPLAEKLGVLRRESERLKIDDRIVDWEASLWHTERHGLYATADGAGVEQRHSYIVPNLSATANRGAETQTRTLGGRGLCRQGGLEVLDAIGYYGLAPGIAREAIALLDAPNCPTGRMDLLLAPDQMILQIHESIGHPLELDRILGDERNYAGTSFVTRDMIGTYRYGTSLLNITFDPTRPEEFASYAYDDEGTKATREFVIKDGILLRALGGATSQARSGIPGVACARASSWNRPPIDRMANLNLEAGSSTFEGMTAAVKRGIYMRANRSWSIDDSRNKFQFGCELGQLIEDGRLTTIVKNPNYRGISATFWRSLKMVGNAVTHDLLGTPYCGKGEPNQAVRVGHASPACLFADVEVFGGA
jgi:predicted Zn-dependent protease